MRRLIVIANRNRAVSLRAEILDVRADRDVVHRGRLRGTASRDGRLRKLLVNPKLKGLVGNRRIRLVSEIQNTCTLGNRAGSNGGKAKHFLLYTPWM